MHEKLQWSKKLVQPGLRPFDGFRAVSAITRPPPAFTFADSRPAAILFAFISNVVSEAQMARLFMLIMLSAALLVAPARAVTIRDFGYFVRDIKLKTSIASDTCARPTGRGGGPSAAHLCLLNLTSMPKSIVWTKILPIGRKPALTVGANSFACKEFTINLRVEFLFRDHKGAEISRNVMSLNDFGGDRVTFEWTVTRQAKINACIAQHCTPLVAAGGGTRANERSSSQLGLAGIFCVAVCNSKY